MSQHNPVRGVAGVALALAVMTALALSGCARTGGDTATQPAASRPASAPASDSQCASHPPTATLSLTEKDNATVACVTAGGRVEILLHADAPDTWATLSLDGSALTPAVSGKRTLPLGVTGGFFTAGSGGTSRVSSFRAPCPQPDKRLPSCDAAHFFQVTIVIG